LLRASCMGAKKLHGRPPALGVACISEIIACQILEICPHDTCKYSFNSLKVQATRQHSRVKIDVTLAMNLDNCHLFWDGGSTS
jgi:hypothetical protein